MANLILKILLILLGSWLFLEIVVRAYHDLPLKTNFYASISQQDVRARQEQVGVRTAVGQGWVHLGWIADPARDTYRIERSAGGGWETVGIARYGSFLLHGQGGEFRVLAVPKDGKSLRVLGTVRVETESGVPPVLVPRIAGDWQMLFKPQTSGFYLNDHTIFQDADGNWRLVGITSRSNGRFDQEKYFAVGVSPDFPPAGGMSEQEPVADFGQLAWAPHVIRAGQNYHMFWSPHELNQMTSQDGITWGQHRVTMDAPFHRFFRDGMVLQVAEGQWLLYTTARDGYFSQVDIYQSFDLREWQYIRPGLRSSWGSERNSPFASTESPFVVRNEGRYYLTVTYNNDSFFWPGILMLFQVWPGRESYNDTLVFQADNPYDFGTYRGRENSPSLLTCLEAHGPEIVHHPDTGKWYITTAGWPWVATLTSGEAAVAELVWEPLR